MVRGSVKGRCAEEAYVIGLLTELHEVVDQPSRWRRPCLAVLHRHDDEEATARDGESALGHKPLDGLLERLVGDAERFERLLARQDVTPGRLIRVDQRRERLTLGMPFGMPNGTYVGPF